MGRAGGKGGSDGIETADGAATSRPLDKLSRVKSLRNVADWLGREASMDRAALGSAAGGAG